MAESIQTVSIAQETRRRYLNYALSVIQSRALPDVRDGLKPVQRRILYTMYHDLHLHFDCSCFDAFKSDRGDALNHHSSPPSHTTWRRVLAQEH